MSIKPQTGITLIEMVLAIVILSVGLAGVLSTFAIATRGSADPLIRKQMLAIAEEMMEEVTLQPYVPVAPAQSNSAGACAARTAFNDVLDYDDLQTVGGVCDIDGTPLPLLAAYNVGVDIDPTATLTTLSGTGNLANVYRITVVVTHGTETLELVGWRTNYAAGL